MQSFLFLVLITWSDFGTSLLQPGVFSFMPLYFRENLPTHLPTPPPPGSLWRSLNQTEKCTSAFYSQATVTLFTVQGSREPCKCRYFSTDPVLKLYTSWYTWYTFNRLPALPGSLLMLVFSAWMNLHDEDIKFSRNIFSLEAVFRMFKKGPSKGWA